MARGWESKAVESQVEEHRTDEAKGKKTKMTAQSAELVRQKEVLVLARARMQNALEATSDPRYQEQIRKALEHIDAQLEEAALAASAGSPSKS